MHTTKSGSEIFPRLNDLHLSSSERVRITAYMHDGELIGDFLCRAMEGIRAAVGHGSCNIAHAAKAASAKPLKH